MLNIFHYKVCRMAFMYYTVTIFNSDFLGYSVSVIIHLPIWDRLG